MHLKTKKFSSTITLQQIILLLSTQNAFANYSSSHPEMKWELLLLHLSPKETKKHMGLARW